MFAVLECSVPDKPLHGDYSVESFSVGSSVGYRCSDGFYLDGDQERVCQEEGTNSRAAWSGAVPQCLRELTGLWWSCPPDLHKVKCIDGVWAGEAGCCRQVAALRSDNETLQYCPHSLK